jgi:formylglycine-generating enzyme required for sulfatase activity
LESDDKTLILYRFDEGQGDKLTDVSGNGHHGTIVGAKWVKAEGPPIPAYRNSLGMEFALVPKGKSSLGGGNGKEGTVEVNTPQDFYLGVYEVTQEEWQKVMGKNPSRFSRGGAARGFVNNIADDELKRFPVEQVNWDEAKEFVKLVNEMVNKDVQEAGWEYRLPTERQWEYACRGGPMADKAESAFDYYLEKPSKTLFKEQANLVANGLRRPCKVGSYRPNRLGLYDMHGNLWEWCDATAGTDIRPCRGGCWSCGPGDCTATAAQHGNTPGDRNGGTGFRVARVPSTAK